MGSCAEMHLSPSENPGLDANPTPVAAGTPSTPAKSNGKEVNFSCVDSHHGSLPTPGVPKTPVTFPKSIIKTRKSFQGELSENGDGNPPPPTSWDPLPPVEAREDPLNVGSDKGAEDETDPFRQMSKGSMSLSFDGELCEGSILSPEEDDYDDEEDFKVHFVHHGKKVQDNMNHQPDLMFQINELQEAVVTMKGSLNEAVMKLSSVEVTSTGSELEEMRRKCEGNSSEILKMVLALKTDFSSIKHEVTAIGKRQEALQKTIRVLLDDRKILATDLSQAGVITQNTRSRLDSSSAAINIGGGAGTPGSGSHSNDSGVALLLEKSYTATFGDESGPLLLSGQRASDQDSLPDQPSLLVPASVYDYVAGLSPPDAPAMPPAQIFCQDSLPRQTTRYHHANHLKTEGYDPYDNDDLGVIYDSDSSLTIAAHKTISLSTCISQEIKINDTYATSHGTSRQPGSPKTRPTSSTKLDGDVIDGKAERSSVQGRRRRPLLGVSSAKLHKSSGPPLCSSSDKDDHARYRYVKGDSRETQRYKLAKELVETEKQYCRTLWTIQDTFAEPLKKAAILSNKDIATLFPEEVYQLYEKHCFLQHQLKERLASWKWQPLVGDILARFTDPNQCEVLRLYTSYVNDFPEVLKTFHKLCHTSQPFTDFIKTCLDQPSCNGLDLGAFLLTPVQRVPKYILLLKQLLKYTSSSHPDHHLIETVLDRLRDFLSRLNDAMEHSFRLVNSSMTPALTTSAIPSPPSKHRCGRTPRKHYSISRDCPSYSPDARRPRPTKQYSHSSSVSTMYRSPKRSCSSAGGASSPKTPSPRSTAARSASLPRGFLSMSSDSHDSSGDGQESSPERSVRSGIDVTLRRRLRSKHLHALAPSRSVADMAAGIERKPRWANIASSEPSLARPDLTGPSKALLKKVPSLSSSQNIQGLTVGEGSHKLVTWTDSTESTEESRGKKKSLKSSIKNIFGFKKRISGNRTNREESLYWPSSVIFETSAEASPAHQQQVVKATNPVSTNGTLTITSGGEFVDEEGNQCSNV